MQTYNIPLNKDRKELTSHGSKEFPIAIYETELKKNILGYVPWHWHEELQFCYVLRGSVDFHINSQVITLTSDQGLFIAPNILHMADSTDPAATYVCLDVKPVFLSSFSDSIISRRYIYPIINSSAFSYWIFPGNEPYETEIIDKMKQIYADYKKKAVGYEIDIHITLLALWKIMFLHMQAQEDRRPAVSFQKDNERIKQIMSYIHEHFSSPITLDEIAEHVALSKNECCRAFKKYMGHSIFQYIISYRISRSEELLLTTNWPVSVIANICGFNSSSYYIDKFKAEKGMTPGEYRSATPSRS